jgi:hypothetical protein
MEYAQLTLVEVAAAVAGWQEVSAKVGRTKAAAEAQRAKSAADAIKR